MADRFDCSVPTKEDRRSPRQVYAICVFWGQLDSRIGVRSAAARFGLRGRHDCGRRAQIHEHLQTMGLIIPILPPF